MADKEAKAPTANEAMFFFHIISHMNSKPDIDWEGVAAAQGLKNAEVAKVRFGQVKRKLGISNDGTTPVKKSSAGASSDNGKSPTKVRKNTGRAGGKKAAAVKMEGKEKKAPDFLKDEDEEDDQKKMKLEKVAEGPKTPTETDQEVSFDDWLQK